MALGHPGATGAMLTCKALLRERTGGRYGMVTSASAGGMGAQVS